MWVKLPWSKFSSIHLFIYIYIYIHIHIYMYIVYTVCVYIPIERLAVEKKNSAQLHTCSVGEDVWITCRRKCIKKRCEAAGCRDDDFFISTLFTNIKPILNKPTQGLFHQQSFSSCLNISYVVRTHCTHTVHLFYLCLGVCSRVTSGHTVRMSFFWTDHWAGIEPSALDCCAMFSGMSHISTYWEMSSTTLLISTHNVTFLDF